MIVPDSGDEGIFFFIIQKVGVCEKDKCITGEVEICIFFTYDCSVNELVILLCYY